MRDADPRVLGQLLAAQNLLPVLPTPRHVADFYARALASIPGVAACRVCLAGCSSAPEGAFPPAEACAACEGAASGAGARRGLACLLAGAAGICVVPLATEGERFGFFVLRIAEADGFEAYRPFVENLGNSLALALENRGQRAGLVAARDALERRVEERTEALTASNRKLAAEIEERRRAEAATRESEERLRQAQKLDAIGRLAGGIAHDFNNLLTVILSCSTSLLELLPEPDPRRVEAEEIVDAARRASQLTRQLLAFGRRQPSAPVPLDLGDVVAGMESLLRRLLGEQVTLEIAREALPARVLVDAGQLEQVILNLAVNARDAMPGGGRLRIETASRAVANGDAGAGPARYVALTVRDTGTGISAEARAHLFEPFFTTKERGKGTGLGLATVYGIVKQAGGDVRVESAPGLGTAFEVRLPPIDGAQPAAVPAPADDAPPRGAETVLLAEDDATVRSATARALRSAGYTIIEAADGEEALARAGASPSLDVLVTDVVMPRLGGSELAERIRALRPGIRILFVSGYAEEAPLRRALAGGGARMLWKPFTAAALARAVRDLVDEAG